MISILDTFETLIIDAKSLISKEDLLFCDILQRKYDSQMVHLNTSLDVMRDAKKELRTTGQERPKEFISLTNTFNIDNVIQNISTCITDLESEFTQKIVSHFENTYNFKLSHDQKIKVSKNWEPTVQQLANHCGGSFVEMGVKEIAKNIKGYLYRDQIEVKGNKVIANKGIRLIDIEGYKGPRVYTRSEQKVKHLSEAFTWFTESKLKASEKFLDLFPSDRFADWGVISKFPHVISVPDQGPVQSLTLYKNGKTVITFDNSDDAQRFFDLFLG